MTYSEIYDKVATELGIPKYVVEYVYHRYWKWIRTSIAEQDFRGTEFTEENINENTFSVSLKYIGKLYIPWKLYKKRQRQYKIYHKDDEYKENPSNVH